MGKRHSEELKKKKEEEKQKKKEDKKKKKEEEEEEEADKKKKKKKKSDEQEEDEQQQNEGTIEEENDEDDDDDKKKKKKKDKKDKKEKDEADDSEESNTTSSSSLSSSSRLPAPPPPSPGLILYGLRNLGNTCFFNSVLQCLASSVPLYGSLFYPQSKYYFSHAIQKESTLQNSFQAFLQQMNSNKQLQQNTALDSSRANKNKNKSSSSSSSSTGYSVFSPASLLSAIQTINPMFRGSRQHDSHELLRTLFNAIGMEKEEELRKKRQLIAFEIVKLWTREQVFMWMNTFQLTDQKQLNSNILNDNEHAWNGAFIVDLIKNWNKAKLPRQR